MRRRIDKVDFAVDEHIWGHRLYDEQLPHLTILEFLTVLLSSTSNPLKEESNRTVTYKPQRQIRLRSLLFNNPYVEAVRDRPISDEDKWIEWGICYAADATGQGDSDMSYLRQVFHSFDDFAAAIDLLRSSAFEGHSNKRWSSKFVFPFGPDALYEDLRFDSSGGVSNDRRFFARTGELLYLMLCRSSRAQELGHLLVERLFTSTSTMNRLVRALQGEPQCADEPRDVGYLPYQTHPRFDRLCDDWMAILSRKMPAYDALEHLIIITGLNLLLYFLECSKRVAGDTDPVEIVCEIVSRERTKVRALSGESFQMNEALSLQAIQASIEAVRATPEWEVALVSEDPSAACATVLHAFFQWPPVGGDEDAGVARSGNEMIKTLIEMAKSRHEQHFGKIHSAWSRSIGLSSRRLSRRTRYAPNDRLLKTLVVTIVDGRMQFDEFLHEAHQRYGLVIGDVEGSRLVRENLVDQETLTDNRGYLESRLLSLGLLRRLSDSCSFVENPFTPEEGE